MSEATRRKGGTTEARDLQCPSDCTPALRWNWRCSVPLLFVLREAIVPSVLCQVFFAFQVLLLYLLEGLCHQVILYALHAL